MPTPTLSDATVDITGAPSSIKIIGANNASEDRGVRGRASTIDFTIGAPAAGLFSFAWDWSTDDFFIDGDPFLFLLNGSATQLTDDFGISMQSGVATFPVELGDTIGFRQFSTDSSFGAGMTTISNMRLFSIPEPSSVLALGLLIFSGSFLRSRRCGS